VITTTLRKQLSLDCIARNCLKKNKERKEKNKEWHYSWALLNDHILGILEIQSGLSFILGWTKMVSPCSA
jgi:hypothetical protein